MIALLSDIHANIEAFRSVYIIYDPDREVLWYRRVSYDIEATQKHYREAGLVNRNADRLERGE